MWVAVRDVCVALVFTAATVVVRLRRVRESGWSTQAPWRRSASSAMHMLHTVVGVLPSWLLVVVVAAVATRVRYGRYRQQIQDIENSMKQTWEEKTKLSVEYEAERRRIVR